MSALAFCRRIFDVLLRLARNTQAAATILREQKCQDDMAEHLTRLLPNQIEVADAVLREARKKGLSDDRIRLKVISWHCDGSPWKPWRIVESLPPGVPGPQVTAVKKRCIPNKTTMKDWRFRNTGDEGTMVRMLIWRKSSSEFIVLRYREIPD